MAHILQVPMSVAVDLPHLACVEDYEDYCRHMTRSSWLYFSGGATTEDTLTRDRQQTSLQTPPYHTKTLRQCF